MNVISIEIIEQMDNKTPLFYTDEIIFTLLKQQVTLMVHGEQFTGRPQTEIYYDDNHVLKTHKALTFNQVNSKRWIEQQLEKERETGVYHAKKTWLLLHFENNEIVIANIMPRLQPLHLCLEKSIDEIDIPYSLDLFAKLFNMYFELSKRTGHRLDEGLSNFALDTDDILYYIDDDIYKRDNWIALAHIIGVYLRKLAWLQGDVAYQFGQVCQQAMLTHLKEKHYLFVLSELLDDIFIPSQREADIQALKQGLLTIETSNITESKKPIIANTLPTIEPFNTDDRYWVLLADVHANLPALEAVLAFLKQQNMLKNILVLGDVVGYGPHPQACIERLQNLACTVIKGNHDHALGGADYSKGYSKTATWVLDWSQDKVSNADKQWLQELPPVLRHERYLALHGAPIDPHFFSAYVYLMTYEDNLNVLEKKSIPLCFHGHTHIPGVYSRYSGSIDKYHQSPGKNVAYNLQKAQHSLICPGSIGQPRNGQSTADFAIYDQEQQKIQYYCIEYDRSGLIKDMSNECFPDSLIQRFR